MDGALWSFSQLPRPTYHVPLHQFTFRRDRGTRTPELRSPFMHFQFDCLSQKVRVHGSDRNYSDAVRAVQQTWLRMNMNQRKPWILMAEKDARTIGQMPPYSDHRLRVGRTSSLRSPRTRRRISGFFGVDKMHDNVGMGNPIQDIGFFHGGEQNSMPFQSGVLLPQLPRSELDIPYHDQLCRYESPTGGSELTEDLEDCMRNKEVELSFLEAHRQRYATPMRSTYEEEPCAMPVPNCDQHHDLLEERSDCTLSPESVDIQMDLPVDLPFLEVHNNRTASPESVDVQVDLPFLEAHRRRYATPERSTYNGE